MLLESRNGLAIDRGRKDRCIKIFSYNLEDTTWSTLKFDYKVTCKLDQLHLVEGSDIFQS